MLKRGLILMVGAAGAGKSTTLAAMINYRNETSSDHILTIEDPIEFLHTNKKSIVNQREVGLDTKSFARALRSAVRAAPDVILIGEIRDKETMEAAIALAGTGHLCIATLHANNCAETLDRIINMFPRDQHNQIFLDLSQYLRAILSQRLVPAKTGQRVAASEVMVNTPHMSELIKKGDVIGGQGSHPHRHRARHAEFRQFALQPRARRQDRARRRAWRTRIHAPIWKPRSTSADAGPAMPRRAARRGAARADCASGAAAPGFASNSRALASHPQRTAFSRQTLGIERERAPCGPTQILIQDSGHAVLDHVDRPVDRISRDRNAAGHRLEVDQPEGIGRLGNTMTSAAARCAARSSPNRYPVNTRMRVLRLQARPLRAVADRRSCCRPTAFAGTPRRSSPPRPGRHMRRSDAENSRNPCPRLEQLGVDAATP